LLSPVQPEKSILLENTEELQIASGRNAGGGVGYRLPAATASSLAVLTFPVAALKPPPPLEVTLGRVPEPQGRPVRRDLWPGSAGNNSGFRAEGASGQDRGKAARVGGIFTFDRACPILLTGLLGWNQRARPNDRTRSLTWAFLYLLAYTGLFDLILAGIAFGDVPR
jgi:hypothetical protein